MINNGVPPITVRPGQIWGDSKDMRELTVMRVAERYVYCIDDNGRRTRISLHRMRPRSNGYYLKQESPAHYVTVPSESVCGCGGAPEHHLSEGCIHCGESCKEFKGVPYNVWTGDLRSPAHCPCENFRWAVRIPQEPYLCKHLRFVLKGEGMT